MVFWCFYLFLRKELSQNGITEIAMKSNLFLIIFMKNVLIFIVFIGLTILCVLLYRKYPSIKNTCLIVGLILIALSMYYPQIKKWKKELDRKKSNNWNFIDSFWRYIFESIRLWGFSLDCLIIPFTTSFSQSILPTSIISSARTINW